MNNTAIVRGLNNATGGNEFASQSRFHAYQIALNSQGNGEVSGEKLGSFASLPDAIAYAAQIESFPA